MWESNVYYIFCVRVCSLGYPKCSAHAPYCRLWPAPLYIIFPYYPINGTILVKKVVNEHKMCVLIFSTSCVWNTAHSKENWAKWDNECLSVCRRSVRCYCQILIKLEFFRHIFEKTHKYQISWKSVQWEPSCRIRPDGHTDRHGEADSRLSQFSERAYQSIHILLSNTTKRLPIDTHIAVQHNKAPTDRYTYCCPTQQSAYR